MIISIKDNWQLAEADHSAYVDDRVQHFIGHFSSRTAVDPHLTDFLEEVRNTAKAGDIEELLKAVVSKTPAGKAAVAGLPAIQALLAKHEGLCTGPHGKDDFRHHLRKQVVVVGRPPDKFDFVRDRVDSYVSGRAARAAADPVTVRFLSANCVGLGSADFPLLLDTIPVFEKCERGLKNAASRKAFRANIAQVFDYDHFVKKDGASWNAFELCRHSRTRICPYCHQAYAFTVFKDDGTGAVRPTLDHFLPQKQFPHLALSLQNLVPSCYTCNSNLKGKTDFHAIPHLHPLRDAEAFEFFIDVPGKSIVDLRSDFENLKSRAQLKIRCTPSVAMAVQNSLWTFLVQERYNETVPEAVAFASLRMDLDSRRKEYSDMFRGRSEAHLLRFDRHAYRDALLGKMYAGIFDQFKS